MSLYQADRDGFFSIFNLSANVNPLLLQPTDDFWSIGGYSTYPKNSNKDTANLNQEEKKS